MNTERIEVKDEYDNLVSSIEVYPGEDSIHFHMIVRTGSIALVNNICLDLDSATEFHRQIGLAIEKEKNNPIDYPKEQECLKLLDQDGTF